MIKAVSRSIIQVDFPFLRPYSPTDAPLACERAEERYNKCVGDSLIDAENNGHRNGKNEY